MRDLLRQGVDLVQSVAASHMAQKVVYTRGEVELEIAATIGATDYEIEEESGLRTAAATVDFIVGAADIKEAFTEPAAGDRIVAAGVTYELMHLPGEGCWRWSNRYRTMIRMHAKEVDGG